MNNGLKQKIGEKKRDKNPIQSVRLIFKVDLTQVELLLKYL